MTTNRPAATDEGLNRWERLAAMPPAEEAMLHFASADDPLDDADLICDGCKEDWPCSFQRGMVAVSNADWGTGLADKLCAVIDSLPGIDSPGGYDGSMVGREYAKQRLRVALTRSTRP